MLNIWMQSFLLPVKPWQKGCTRTMRLLQTRESPISPQLSQTSLVWELTVSSGPCSVSSTQQYSSPCSTYEEVNSFGSNFSSACPYSNLSCSSALQQESGYLVPWRNKQLLQSWSDHSCYVDSQRLSELLVCLCCVGATCPSDLNRHSHYTLALSAEDTQLFLVGSSRGYKQHW